MMTPATKAKLAVFLYTFLGGIFAYLAPRLSGGVPPESEWPSIAVGALVFGAVALHNRLAPSPVAPVDLKAKTITVPNGFARIEILLGVSFVIASLYVLVACTPAQTAAGKNATQCIIDRAEADANSGMPPVAIIADTALFCLTDEITVVTTLEHAQHAADATKSARVRK